jgi:WS/DGAT/MGAT family acyltransferase
MTMMAARHTPQGPNTSSDRFSHNLNASDELLWSIERDPCLRSTIVAVSLLDRAPDWERLNDRLAEVSATVPRLRERVVAMPFRAGPLHWERDEFFDLGYHLRRIVAPAPGDIRTLLDLAGPIAMGAFDKDRPLWEFTLVEGLDAGQAAFIQKIHHSLTDGIGAVKLARLMLDDRRNPPRRKPSRRSPARAAAVKPSDGRPPMGGLASLTDAAAANVRGVFDASLHGLGAFPNWAVKSALNPAELMTTTARQVRSVGKLLAPVTQPLSPVMTRRGMSRRLDVFDVPLAALRKAAHRAESTLNDAFLASIASGMSRYHERHDAPVSALRVTMPINTRRPGDPAGSNRFTPARFVIPVGPVDAAERMQLLGELARNWRKEPALPLTDAIAGILTRLPVAATTAIFGSMLKAVDFVATNVPGIDRRTYLAGAEIVREYAFAPPSGSAFSVALLSHVDQCCVGINADVSAVDDPDVLTACLREGFDEILAVGSRPS